LPSISPFTQSGGQGKADNAQENRFDDDPFSWVVVATLDWNLWDGGIREAQMSATKSKLRQATLAAEDLASKIK